MVALGLHKRLLLLRWISELGFLRSSPPGARGSAYIVLPIEYGPSDQTDINRTVFLNPGHDRPPARSRGFWTLLDVG